MFFCHSERPSGCEESTVNTLTSLHAQVGQLLIMGFDGAEPAPGLLQMLTMLQPGGVILFARNILDARQTWDLLRACREAVGTPMFLCVDMEGGTVDRLKNAIAPAPSAADVAATQSKKMFRSHGRLIGEEVCALGFNTDFAPVLDLSFAASRSVLTSRTVSDDPKQAIIYAREFLKGLQESHVLGCGKHFPGLGEANLDTHEMLPTISKSWKRLWAEDLHPYRALRRAMAFVMVAHAAYPAVTKTGIPSSLSAKWLTEILRRKIGYRGLVISDDLEMGGVQASAPIDEAAIETLRAGADMFLVCHNEAHVWRTYEAVVREAEHDSEFARRVAAAARRVLAFKKKARELKRTAARPSTGTVRKLRDQMRKFSDEVQKAAVVL
jgi:beta-N-acetylhexosaminidase